MTVWKLSPRHNVWHWGDGRYSLCGFVRAGRSLLGPPEEVGETFRCRSNGCRQKWVEWDERRQRNQVRAVDSEAGRAVALPAGRIEGRPSHGGEADRGRDPAPRGSSDRAAGIHAGEAGSGAVQVRTTPAGFLAGVNLDLSGLNAAFTQLGNSLVNCHPITFSWSGAGGSYGHIPIASTATSTPTHRAKCACGEPKNGHWEHSELECTWLNS